MTSARVSELPGRLCWWRASVACRRGWAPSRLAPGPFPSAPRSLGANPWALAASFALGLLIFAVAANGQGAPAAVEELFEAIADASAPSQPAVELVVNLNARELASRPPSVPRLGGFADLPAGAFPDSAELAAWEAAFSAGDIGGLVLHSAALLDSGADPLGGAPTGQRDPQADFADWISVDERNRPRDRIFITFANQDEALAGQIGALASTAGYDSLIFASGGNDPEAEPFAGRFYATAQHRLALDSRAARRLRTGVAEMELLGERARRDSDSVFRDPVNRDDRGLARHEPEVFRKITLGDEFTQPTIEEIIVPGGIALGESAEIDFTPVELVFDPDGAFFILRALDEAAAGGVLIAHQLPRQDPKRLKSLFDLTQRSIRTRSDAVVDLDADRRVRISSALRDTDAGYDMLFADTRPFAHLDYLPVTKSVIIDTGVSWGGPAGGTADSPHFDTGFNTGFKTGFEVRFLSADRMRIAQTRLALAYSFDSTSGAVAYQGNWGRDSARLRESTDLGRLGDELAEMARDAGWVALFRRLEEDRVPFLKGRYEFLKIDKAGRETPRRFR